MIKDLKKNIAIVKYVFKFCPLYVVYTLLNIILSTVSTVLKVGIINEVVIIVEESIKGNGKSFKDICISLGIYLIIIIITTIYTTIYNNFIKGRYRISYISKMRAMMYKKARNVDYESFDNPTFYDMYSRAMRDGSFRGIRVYEDITQFVAALVNALALGTIIVITNWIILLLIAISVIVRVILGQKVNKNIQRFDEETETDRRMYGYVKRTFYQERFASEIKSTSIGDLLIDKCQEAKINIDEKCKDTYKKNIYLNSGSILMSNIFEFCLVYVYLVYKLFEGLTIATFSTMISATKQFSANLYQMLSVINKIKTNALYIDYFIDYMNYRPKLETVGTIELNEPFEELLIKDVSFSYPLTDRNALTNINLSLKKGEKLAIVGLNGAGKTTLIKLLLKFYNPTSGYINYNKTNIIDVKEDNIRSKYSILFQDYRIYGVTIGENILMRKVETKADEELIWKALEYVGMKEKIEKYPEKLKTMCTKEFRSDGAEFSGGELQKLVIARVFASNADIYILDEPTSNLDPLSERNINRLIMENSPDKAMIIIAHRLSTVVDADRIVLIENGKIIENGTHEELMSLKGKYHNMFTTQGLLYQNAKK